jgi:hypothetical protein
MFMSRRIILALLILLADLPQAIAQNTQSEFRPELYRSTRTNFWDIVLT